MKKYLIFGTHRLFKRSLQIFISLTILGLLSLRLQALSPGSFVTKGPTSPKKIALTFDDGPGPQTEKFLDLLDQYKVKATFFMLSEQVGYRKAMAKMVANRGHEIGNHTTKHINYALYAKTKGIDQAKADLVADMKASRKTIEDATGAKLKILRMPHGIDRSWIKDAAQETGFILVNWTYGSDWVSSPIDEQEKSYLKAIEPGAIFLFHDGGSRREKSLSLTEAVIKSAQEYGFEIVTVGELLGLK